MSRNPKLTWRQRMRNVSLPTSLLVGVIFATLGQNPYYPDDLFGNNPQNDLFLWLSTITFIVTIILSYTLWPLVRAEATRKDTSTGQESPPLWYQEKNIQRASWLGYMVLFPSLSIMEIFRNLALLSHLEIFKLLNVVALLVFVIASFVGTTLTITGFRERARERETRQQTDR